MSESDLISWLDSKRIAVVVAHPGDESLWFGGLLTTLPHGAVDVIVAVAEPASRKPDTTVRLYAFARVAHHLDCERECLWIPDCGPEPEDVPSGLAENIEHRITSVLDFRVPEVIIGHGSWGEPCNAHLHGHAMHKVVASACVAYCQRHRLDYVARTRLRDEATWEVAYDKKQKQHLLQCYSKHWTPDGRPWDELERYVKV